MGRSRDRDDKKRKKNRGRKRRHRSRSPHHSSDNSDDDDSDSIIATSSVSASDADDNSSLNDDDDRKERRSKKYSKKDDRKHRKKKSRKDDKKDKKSKSSKKKRKYRDKDDDDDRKERKKHRKTSRRHRSSSYDENDDMSSNSNDDTNGAKEMKEKERNYILAEALYELLQQYPTSDMANNTLPLLLIKLGGGTTIDLRQMPDQRAANGLHKVLESLQSFGLTQEGGQHQVWKWIVPGGGNTAHKDERILLRIVRTLLNDIGFTMDSLEHYENKLNNPQNSTDSNNSDDRSNKNNNTRENNELQAIKEHTSTLLKSFQEKQSAKNDKNYGKSTTKSTLPGELGGLCKMILEGESIALDGLPDATLRESLEKLFENCGLELLEMEDDDSEEEEENNDDDGCDGSHRASKSMGYGLPEDEDMQSLAKAKIFSVIDTCEQAASAVAQSSSYNPQTTRPLKGPMPMPQGYQAPEDSSDEEGPAPVGSEAARRKDPALSKEQLRLQAEMRARQLKGAVTGQEELMSTEPNQREEWMLVPGKFDFLSSIKAGNPMKSRNFKAQSKADGEANASGGRAIDPRVKAEMDAIMQAHADARGPTLVEQHRLKKEEERKEKAAAAAAAGVNKKGQWNWSRDKDLDSGRRVDTNALNMVLGGANQDLKKKFQGGF